MKFPSPSDAQQNSPSSGLADWMTMGILGVFLLFLLGGICLCIFLKKFRVFGSRCPFCNWPSLSAREPARVYVLVFAQWSDTRFLFEINLSNFIFFVSSGNIPTFIFKILLQWYSNTLIWIKIFNLDLFLFSWFHNLTVLCLLLFILFSTVFP